MKITDVTDITDFHMAAVHISKHSRFRSQDHCRCVDCARVPSIHFSLDEDTLKITVGVSGVWCVVLVVCGLFCCGGACVWCVVKLGTLSLSLALSPSSSLSLSLSLSFSLSIFIILSSFSFFFFSCSFSYSCSCSCSFSFSSLSLLLATKHYGKNRSTNTAANIEAFECDLAQGKCTAIGSLPPPLPSLLPSPPPLLKKRKLFITGIFPARELFCITVSI